MQKFDLVFVGNGILSFVSALKVAKENPRSRLAIVGPGLMPFSASVAAGAMQAVFCEVEETFHHLSRDREIFEVGLEARKQWHELIAEFGLQDIVTAESTIMYARKEGTPFEKVNFEAACSVANDHGCLEDVSSTEMAPYLSGKLKSSDVVAKKFVGEFAIDSDRFFQRAKAILSKLGVTFVDAKVQKINQVGASFNLSLHTGESVEAARVVVAAGSESGALLPAGHPMVPVFHAVGTAIVLDSAPAGYSAASSKVVIRTPNRGGAQCGMHIVPRNEGQFYLGAGNYLSDKQPAHRVETIRYLIDICETELFGKQVIYSAKAQMLLGSRPKSVDGFPIVGTTEQFPGVFVSTGTYRIGLTIAPVIAREICNWYQGKKISKQFESWSPARKLHSYAPMSVATRYFSESRISNLVEHGLLDFNDDVAVAAKKTELESMAKDLNRRAIQKQGLPADFVVDPDMYSILS